VIGGSPSGDASGLQSAASLFGAMPEPSELSIDPQRLAAWIAEDPQLQVVDVREPYEREAGHIAGTLHIEMNRLSSQAATLDRDRPVVFYCRVGARSTMAAQALRAAGFDAYSMSGGLLRWYDEGRPLSPDGGRVADH
jgi:rhodanese-related sulfurtransferase